MKVLDKAMPYFIWVFVLAVLMINHFQQLGSPFQVAASVCAMILFGRSLWSAYDLFREVDLSSGSDSFGGDMALRFYRKHGLVKTLDVYGNALFAVSLFVLPQVFNV